MDHNFDHDKFMHSTYELLKVIQICDSTSSICKCIRMGKENDKKYNSSTIHKAIDPITGEVKVGQSYVKKSTWERSSQRLETDSSIICIPYSSVTLS